MRKKSPRKLELSFETLRNLNSTDLLHAAGGLPETETCECPTVTCSKKITRCTDCIE